MFVIARLLIVLVTATRSHHMRRPYYTLRVHLLAVKLNTACDEDARALVVAQRTVEPLKTFVQKRDDDARIYICSLPRTHHTQIFVYMDMTFTGYYYTVLYMFCPIYKRSLSLEANGKFPLYGIYDDDDDDDDIRQSHIRDHLQANNNDINKIYIGYIRRLRGMCAA